MHLLKIENHVSPQKAQGDAAWCHSFRALQASLFWACLPFRCCDFDEVGRKHLRTNFSIDIIGFFNTCDSPHLSGFFFFFFEGTHCVTVHIQRIHIYSKRTYSVRLMETGMEAGFFWTGNIPLHFSTGNAGVVSSSSQEANYSITKISVSKLQVINPYHHWFDSLFGSFFF